MVVTSYLIPHHNFLNIWELENLNVLLDHKKHSNAYCEYL